MEVRGNKTLNSPLSLFRGKLVHKSFIFQVEAWEQGLVVIHLPVIHIVKQNIELMSGGKSWSLWYELMIGIIEFA